VREPVATETIVARRDSGRSGQSGSLPHSRVHLLATEIVRQPTSCNEAPGPGNGHASRTPPGGTGPASSAAAWAAPSGAGALPGSERRESAADPRFWGSSPVRRSPAPGSPFTAVGEASRDFGRSPTEGERLLRHPSIVGRAFHHGRDTTVRRQGHARNDCLSNDDCRCG
jgi:hypothetical protein